MNKACRRCQKWTIYYNSIFRFITCNNRDCDWHLVNMDMGQPQ